MDDTSRYPALSPLARQAGFLGVLPFVAALAGVLSGSTELRLLAEPNMDMTLLAADLRRLVAEGK